MSISKTMVLVITVRGQPQPRHHRRHSRYGAPQERGWTPLQRRITFSHGDGIFDDSTMIYHNAWIQERAYWSGHIGHGWTHGPANQGTPNLKKKQASPTNTCLPEALAL